MNIQIAQQKYNDFKDSLEKNEYGLLTERSWEKLLRYERVMANNRVLEHCNVWD